MSKEIVFETYGLGFSEEVFEKMFKGTSIKRIIIKEHGKILGDVDLTHPDGSRFYRI